MTEFERDLTEVSLSIVALFYLVTVLFIFISDKTRLNVALALQKMLWFIVIVGVAIPAYGRRYETMPSDWRTGVFFLLAPITLWVLVEVYVENRGTIARRVRYALRLEAPRPWQPGDPDRRVGPKDRRRA